MLRACVYCVSRVFILTFILTWKISSYTRRISAAMFTRDIRDTQLGRQLINLHALVTRAKINLFHKRDKSIIYEYYKYSHKYSLFSVFMGTFAPASSLY